MTILQELNRRKVVRTTIAYLAAAFVAAQVTQLITEGLDLPGWILKAVLIVEIVALPLVIGIAWAFDLTPDGIERTGPDPTTSHVALPWKRIALPATASLLLLLAILAFLSLNKSASVTLDRNLVAVLPFRVSGSEDIGYLREGMIDLLAAKLTGEGGPRAVSPRAVMSAWQRAAAADEQDVKRDVALDVARDLGAGQMLLGSVVGTNSNLTISAQLVDVRSGHAVSAARQGSADTLAALIDHLTAELLSLGAGETSQRLAALTSASLPALRSYLAGQSAYRAGHFGDAVRAYSRALDLDSTFALAAMGHILALGWGEMPSESDARSVHTLLAYQDRLGPADRAMARAIIGTDSTDNRSVKQILLDWESAIAAAPDRSDAWSMYGDMLFHFGALAEDFDAHATAVEAFNRALALDSSNTPALVHLLDEATTQRDLAEFRRLDAIRAARDPSGQAARYQFAWRSRFLEDTAALRALRASLDTAQLTELRFLQLPPMVGFGGVDDAILATDKWLQRATTSEERDLAYSSAHVLYIALGMPSRAAAILQKQLQSSHDSIEIYALAVFDRLYGDGDDSFAARAVTPLRRFAASSDPRLAAPATCIVDQWDLLHGRAIDMAHAKEVLAAGGANADAAANAQVCLRLLAALDAKRTHAPDQADRIAALDAVLRVGPDVDPILLNVANYATSQLYAGIGDNVSAYRAIRRRSFHPDGLYLRFQMIREGGRLAVVNGDRKEAVALYQHYLQARTRAEPSVKAQDDAVRRALVGLAAET